MIGQIVFDYEILGYWTDPTMVDFDYVDKVGATYPTLVIAVSVQGRQKIMFIMVAVQPVLQYLVIGYLLVLIKEH